MDKIYSRKRIKLPKIKFDTKDDLKKIDSRNNNDFFLKSKKITRIFFIIIIAFFVFFNILKQIEPIIEKECINKAKSIATIVSNNQASIIMGKYKYDDLCNIVKDDSQNIKLIKSNIVIVNEIISKVALGIQNELNKLQTEKIYISLGNFTGSKFLSGRGPKVSFKILQLGNVETDLKSEFVSAGINQTMHKIFLQIYCSIIIVTPFNQVEQKITNQILIAEAIILGNVPSSYYNLEGLKRENVLEIIE